MFQPETEDMLPRMAPKPSAAVPSGASDEIVRPQVPEVSILFGQQEGSVSQQPINAGVQQPFKNNPQQTYAAWKKQILPKVTYPAAANMADMQLQENTNNKIIGQDYNPRINLYPLRTSTSPLNMATNGNSNGFCAAGGLAKNPVIYRRSLESCNNNMAYQQIATLTAIPSQNQLPAIKSLFAQSSNTNHRDVLTICAGTQTEATLDSPKGYLQNVQSAPWSNLASKKDLDDLRQMLDEMRHEQQSIVKMLETLLFSTNSQAAVKPQSRNIGVQAEDIESCGPPCTNGGIALIQEPQIDLPQSVPKIKFLEHLKTSNNILRTPNGKPMAQSTTYRPNSPQSQRFQQDLPEVASAPTYLPASVKAVPITPKPASDTSLVMSELALKYLPNEKLAELLKELNMDCPTKNAQHATPVRRNVDKFEKRPTDISNASYKYLKKYRLLPDDHENGNGNGNGNNNVVVVAGFEGESEKFNENQMLQYNSPQYNNIRNTPIHQRQTPTNKCSPYSAGRLPLSPLARVSPPPLQSAGTQQHIVNLENIKQQPKFI